MPKFQLRRRGLSGLPEIKALALSRLLAAFRPEGRYSASVLVGVRTAHERPANQASPRIVTSGGVATALRVPSRPAAAIPIPPPRIPITGIQ